MDILGILGGGIWYVVFFILALSVIVAIHEYGHYIVGRWSGIHAEVFSLGFGKVLASRVDRRGTRWQIAAIPFGGYVKFMGDADAASVRADLSEGLSPEERRRTMAGAPLWARAATVIAGPMANFLLTFVMLAGMVLTFGVAVEKPTVGKLVPTPEVQTLKEGDVILAMGGTQTPDLAAFSAALEKLPRQPLIEFTVERAGQRLDLTAPHPQPALVASVQVKSAAVDAGLRPGDVILRANDSRLVTFTDLQDVVFGSNGTPVTLQIWRDGQVFDDVLTPRSRSIPLPEGGFETKWMMGIGGGLTFQMATRSAGPAETLGLALGQMWAVAGSTFSGLWHMATGQISTCNMSGVIGMAEAVGDAAKLGLRDFLMMVAMLSMGVGILNLLPIPVLDGGHLVFYAYEAVFRRPPSDKALRVLMTVGLALLIGLMVFALGNDVTCV